MANYAFPTLKVSVDSIGNGFTLVSDVTPLPVSATLTTSDIEIGAVEIKNDTTDDRAKVILLADNTATPTTLIVGSFCMVYDGATWDFLRGDATNGVKVQPAVGGAGAVTAVTERVTLASDDPAVVALQIMDDWDETDRAKVNIIAGQAGVTAGAGAVAANTQRVTLASDDPAVASLSVLDDWDETNRAAVNLIAGQVGVQGGAGVVTVLTQRVAFATDANVVDTELPAAAAISGDATAAPTSPAVYSFMVGYDRASNDWTRLDAVVDGQVVAAAAAGFLMLGTDGTNYQVVKTDTTGSVQVDIESAIPAGTNNIGDVDVLTQQVGKVIRPTITVTATTYVANKVIGGIITLSSVMSGSGRSAVLKSLVVKHAGSTAPTGISFLFFRATPSGGTYTDTATLVWGASDDDNMVGIVRVVTADWYTLISRSHVAVGGIDQIMGSADSDLYMLIIADGNYVAAATSDLTVELGFEQR